MENDRQMNKSTHREKTKFFDIPFACGLMQKSATQVLEQCAKFGATLYGREDLRAFEDELAPDEVLKIHQQYNARISFDCTFKIQDYAAICFVSFNFVSDTAVECLVSLGRPLNLERYSSEKSVLKVFLVSLEKLYLNGRIQQDYPEERVYTWKKDNRTLVSFVSYPRSGPGSTGKFLSLQIRDTQLHPQGRELELLYNKTQKRVENLKWVQEDRRRIPFEKIYKNRRTLYRLTWLLFIGMIVLGVGGIIALFSKSFVAAIVLIVFGGLCGYSTSKLYGDAVKDYLQQERSKISAQQNR